MCLRVSMGYSSGTWALESVADKPRPMVFQTFPVRSVMWPEEKTLEETISELSGSNHIESWAADQGGGSSLSTAATASTAGTDGDDNGSTQLEKEGLGPDGGSKEEWESMTTPEKVKKGLGAQVPFLHHSSCFLDGGDGKCEAVLLSCTVRRDWKTMLSSQPSTQ